MSKSDRIWSISLGDRRIISRLLICKNESFTSFVEKSGIDPRNDLRGLDLGPIFIDPTEDISQYDFSQAKLRGATFCGVDLTKSIFHDADLTDADFRGAKFREEQLVTAYVDGMRVGAWTSTSTDTRNSTSARMIGERELILRNPVIKAAFEHFPDAELVDWTRKR